MEKFKKPLRKPTSVEQRKMFGKAIELMIEIGMENHIYKFGNKVRMQKKGGPIGLALTGEVADCYMLNWDRKYLERLESLGIKTLLYSRLKDDILISTRSLEKGAKYVDGELIKDRVREMEDEEESDTKVTMNVLQEIANSVDPMISFTYPMQL